MFDIIAAMGRMRIKKKELVIPFRETLAYRLLLTVLSLVIFFITMYQLIRSIQSQNNVGLIVSSLTGSMALAALVYNVGQVKSARIPERTLKRVKRR